MSSGETTQKQKTRTCRISRFEERSFGVFSSVFLMKNYATSLVIKCFWTFVRFKATFTMSLALHLGFSGSPLYPDSFLLRTFPRLFVVTASATDLEEHFYLVYYHDLHPIHHIHQTIWKKFLIHH